MLNWVLYSLVICAYLPGLIKIVRFRGYGKFPLILFCFLGMFIFNAGGSILVLRRETTFSGVPLFSIDYIAMLIAQVLIFYLITEPYIRYRKDTEYSLEVKRSDYAIIPVFLLLIVYILTLYRRNVGGFLINNLLEGDINQYTAGVYRSEGAYGSPFFEFYELGFYVFPGLLAAHVFLISLAKKKFKLWHFAVIFLCMVPGLLMGDKGGIIRIAALLFMAYIFYLGVNNQSVLKVINLKSSILFVLSFIPTFISYIYYYVTNLDFNYFNIIKDMFYRIFSVYSETFAAVVPLTREYGFYLGNTLPFLGMWADSKNYISLDGEMHFFIAGSTGAATVPAVTEGFANFGWPGFFLFAFLFVILVVIFQEVLIRIKAGFFSYTVMLWYAYLTVLTTTVGLFGTFLSLFKTCVAFAVIVGYQVLVSLFSKKQERELSAELK